MYMDERATPRIQGRPDLPPPQTAAGGCCGTFGRTHFPLAMVYTPVQSFDNLYDTKTALQKGTLFKELDLPFRGKSIAKGGTA